MPEKKLFLLDGHALVYRAHFAFIARPLINSKGMNTSAITGFTRTLWDLLNNEKPTHIAIAFDPPSPTFRHEMYQEYKANREEQPADISLSFPYIHRIVAGFKIPIVAVNGYEADDVIGTLAKKAETAGYTVYMVTPDKDYAQLVSDHIFMYKPSRQGNGIDILGAKEVLEQWSIKRVDQVIDVLGLQGDAVDNIPGIPGIGPKTAVKLLEEYDTVEGLIQNAASLKGKQQESVIKYAEQALLSKKLATIEINVPIAFDEKAFELEPFDRSILTEVFKELEFRSLATQILGSVDPPQTGTQGNLFAQSNISEQPKSDESFIPAHSVAEYNIYNTPHEYYLADTPEKQHSLLELLSESPYFCFDTETTHIDPTLAELVGMSFSVAVSQAYYVPVPADLTQAQLLVNQFKEVLEDEKINKIGQNLKYDITVFNKYGVKVAGKFFDTMVAHYLLEPSLRHNMDYLAETYLKYQPVSIETLIGKKKDGQMTMRDVEIEKVKDYAAEDADITLQLRDHIAPWLEKEGLNELYYTIEEPLIRVLADMEYEGINLDKSHLKAYSKELTAAIAQLQAKVKEQCGEDFNLASPRQVGEILFEKMNIPYRWGKTKTGQYSTDEDKLAELSQEYPLVNDILRHRTLTKLLSTYVDALPKMVNQHTGRIHSSFNQALVPTGRLSSNNPNLQNIPVRTPEGAKVREAFVPRDENHLLLSADYSQIELRIIAEISGDEAMLDAFAKGLDIHTATAANVFNVPFEEVSKEQRYRAKTVNFSIIYGAGATNLSRQLGIKRQEASDLINQYFAKYQGLKHYMVETVEFARKNGYVSTLMGRKRKLREIHSNSSLERSNAERIAINTPIQGTAADMIKLAMIKIHKALKEKNLNTRMILQVHDELLFDVPTLEVETVKPIIAENMRTAIPHLKVPILVEMGVGKNWREAH